MLFCDKKYWKLIQHAVTNAVASLDHLDYLGAGRHLRTVRGGFHIYECYLQVGAQDFREPTWEPMIHQVRTLRHGIQKLENM